jgi:UDP-N-acetyl-D-galactosamine dehydrogenase
VYVERGEEIGATSERIAVLGLGYVGLPVALAFARQFERTFGFDINSERVQELRRGCDRSGEVSAHELASTSLVLTHDAADLAEATLFVVAVPTPINRNNRPDLAPLITASELLGRVMRPGSIVVYESTVYPGGTEEVCGAVLARVSGMKQGVDFKLAYSPERINPGDREHTLERITRSFRAKTKRPSIEWQPPTERSCRLVSTERRRSSWLKRPR